MRLFIPIILVVAAIGLFVVYTNPTYQASKALASRVNDYNNALDKSKELRAVRDQLLSKRNTFAPADVQKLEELLPDNVDNIRLIIDINNIATRHGLILSDVQIGDLSSGKNSKSTLTNAASGGPVGTVSVGFAVDTTYDNMLSFVTDLEHSLRLVDIQKMNFDAGSGGVSSYSFTINTYWLH